MLDLHEGVLSEFVEASYKGTRFTPKLTAPERRLWWRTVCAELKSARPVYKIAAVGVTLEICQQCGRSAERREGVKWLTHVGVRSCIPREMNDEVRAG